MASGTLHSRYRQQCWTQVELWLLVEGTTVKQLKIGTAQLAIAQLIIVYDCDQEQLKTSRCVSAGSKA